MSAISSLHFHALKMTPLMCVTPEDALDGHPYDRADDVQSLWPASLWD